MNPRISILWIVLASLPASAAETIIDDFEGTGAPDPWTVVTSAATGQLALGPGHTGHGAQLSYQFTNASGYVGMNLALTPSVTTDAIGFWAQEAPGVQLWLVVVDSSGQQLEYYLPRPLTAMNGNGWFRQVVELDAPTVVYGGANDGLVHPPFVGLTLFVTNPDFPQLTGSFGLDEVVAISPLQGSLDLDAGVLVPFDATQGDLFAGVGVNIHFTNDDTALDIAKAAGFRWIRMDAAWGAIEQSLGVYNFADGGGLSYDSLIASLQARQMGALLILDYSNPLYPQDGYSYGGTEQNSPASTPTIVAYSNFASALAKHFAGQGVRYEIWNEPNGNFWFPVPNAQNYVNLANSATTTIHIADPTALVTSGGLDAFDWPFLSTELTALQRVQAFGIHPYRSAGPETVSDDLYEMRSLMQGAGQDAGYWQTEWGYWSSVPAPDAGAEAFARKRQGIDFVREILACRMAGFPFVILYDIRDDGTDPTNIEDTFGLIDSNNQDKPAIVGIRTLNGVATGRTMVGAYEMTPSSVHAVRFEGPSDVVVALWADNYDGGVAVTLQSPASAIDFQGNTVTLTASDGGVTVQVNEGDGPIYLTWPKPTGSLCDGGCDDGGAVLPVDGGRDDGGTLSPDGGPPAPSSKGCGGCATGGDLASVATWLLGLVTLAQRRRSRRSP